MEKELPVNLKPQKIHTYTHTKKTVSETQNHSNANTHTRARADINIHTHNYKHIKYQRWVKQTKVYALQERGTTTPI